MVRQIEDGVGAHEGPARAVEEHHLALAETNERVGGFFIIEARDLNDAIRVASKHPDGEPR
jgi:hypothetical protein